MKHAMMLTPSLLKQHMLVFQDSYPMDNERLINNSRMFVINMPGLLERFLQIFIAAADEKYKKILRILNKNEQERVLKEVKIKGSKNDMKKTTKSTLCLSNLSYHCHHLISLSSLKKAPFKMKFYGKIIV